MERDFLSADHEYYIIVSRRRTNARIAELSDIAEQMKAKAAKLEKDKNRLTIELREITIELDTVSKTHCIDSNLQTSLFLAQ